MSEHNQPQTKTCTACFEERPITEFRRRYKNSEERHTRCRRCYNKEQSERRKAQRRRKVCKYVTDVLAAKRDRDRVIGLTRHLASKLGGFDSIGTQFAEILQEAKDAGRISMAFRVLVAVMELSIVAEELMDERVREMSDEDLHAVMVESSLETIKQHPEIAVLAAYRLGWTVVPPDDVLAEIEAEVSVVVEADQA